MRLILLSLIAVATLSTAYGQTQFHRRYGSPYHDQPRRVIQTQDGNYLIVGYTNGFGSGGNALLMKVNAIGVTLWIKDYSGINADEIFDIIELSDKKLIMCGQTFSYGAGANDAFVMKTDSIGNLVWARAYGDIGYEFFVKIAADGQGGFYVAGGTYEFTTGLYSSNVIKIDGSGNVLWSKAVNDWTSSGALYGLGMTAIASGGVILGENVSPNTSFSLYKFSYTGTLVWSNNYFPTPQGSGLFGLSIIENDNAEIYVNYALSNVNTVAQALDNFVIKLDSSGNLIWNKSYGGTYSDNVVHISNTNDGGIILCGITNSVGNGADDVCLIKLTANGTIQWAKAYGTAWDDRSANGIQTADNGYVFTGQTWPVGSSFDSSKVYLVKTDSLGNTSCNSISWFPTTNNQTINITSAFVPVNMTFQENTINWNLNNRYLYTADICNPALVESIAVLDNCNIYPNPFSSQTTLITTEELNNATLSVINCIGQIAKEIRNITGKKVVIDRNNLRAGLYFIRLIQENKVIATDKLVIKDN